MRWGKSRGRGAVAALAILAFAAAAAPIGASATDSDLKHSYAFRLEASNGYSILAVADSQRADGRGELVLFVGRGSSGAIYLAPATVTATRIDADLGRLGRVGLDVVPSGRERSLRSHCEEGPRTFSFEPQAFRGSFEFHGEEGFTEASSSSPHEYTRFFSGLYCGASGGGEILGPGLPGARLGLRARHGSSRLTLQANKNRPGARTRLEVESHEERRGVGITRSTTAWVGSRAFDYDPLLRTATLSPPAPFSGSAAFHRAATAANRWSGDLRVDLPGRSDVPLSGVGVEANLVPACRSEGKVRSRENFRGRSTVGCG